ncbi:BLUF domain-containing protein [Hymenobacter arizonensis]|uniref:Sensors of blue-light using FAD n=1 Tax=Hymenobacter arizonensis TaxID=1227077 RepID=A0A1I5Z0Z6_HYMAR|nr:BLUF domain-containing protein [Hymenobacter arizonensis]SFQ50174.1 Sensors of blue-light using FAD [Hymenobacter arizonensis]
MHHIVYSSRTIYPFNEADLKYLMNQWRAKNARLDVTGVLLYSEGDIMQVLEGPAAAVQGIFKTIAADVRHQAVIKLSDGPVQGRAFANWSMRFRAVDTDDFERFVQQTKAASQYGDTLAPLLEVFMAPEAW